MIDAVLVVSFGGPEGPDDVMPFLKNVTRGRRIPPERLVRVAAQYLDVGGVSPIQDSVRRLVAGVRGQLAARGRPLPVYWGNRNWHPYLADTVERMRAEGVRRAAAFVTSAYSSYSGCRQYIDDIAAARRAAGEGAPEIVKLRPFYNHPGFVEPLAGGLRAARAEAGPAAPVLMSAHSIPLELAATCDYEVELRDAAGLVSAAAGEDPRGWSLVYQSRSGPPDQPWLGPDVESAVAALAPGCRSVIVVPLGFVVDHMEVVYDLDRLAATAAARRGVTMVRSATPGDDPRFAAMVCDLVEEAADPAAPRRALGARGPAAFPCAPGCCPGPAA